LNRAARNRDRKMLRKQNKTNIKERQKLWKWVLHEEKEEATSNLPKPTADGSE
jgi:hypothetical protein